MLDKTFVEQLAQALAKRIVPEIRDANGAKRSLKRLLTAAEAAEFLSCSRNAVYKLAARRRVAVVRRGRSLRFDIKNLVGSKGDK
jgi:excisionase family DNA binding protein